MEAFGGRGLDNRATAEPWLKDHPDVFGQPLSAEAGLKRADVLVTNSDGGKTFFDITITLDARIRAGQEMGERPGEPGRSERTARDRKAVEYNPTFAGAGVKVEALCATPYGDILGASKDALRAAVRRRTRELAAASQSLRSRYITT